MRSFVPYLFVVAALGCNGGSGSDSSTSTQQVAAYEATDACSAHRDEAVCNADTASGCDWVNLEVACPQGTDCPSGVCEQPDPCRDHGDAASCGADASCAWAAVELCPPPGESCPGGFCHTRSEGCACACPLYCPEGTECPPCECDCPTDPGGGDDCTCACPACAEGETCPPCNCSCDGGAGGSCGAGTCTCVCPACAEGESCPPCDCNCGDASSGASPETCVCPTCAPEESCTPCSCDGGGDDPCLAHADETSCAADAGNECQWIAIGAPCSEGEPCRSGVCQRPSGGGGDGCTCVCPDCRPGETCPPCDCAAAGGGSTG